MLRHASSAVCGAAVLQLFKELPSLQLIIFVGGLGVICTVQRRRQGLRQVGTAAIGFAVMAFSAASQLADRLTPSLSGIDITLCIYIVEKNKIKDVSTSFTGRVLNRPDLPRRIRLSWYDAERIPAIGETWRLRVRLKRPRGLSNAGGFDSERYFHRQRIGASGYVLPHRDNRRLDGRPAAGVDRLRGLALERIERVLPKGDASAVLKAIGVGARGDITDGQWRRYARTGTSHLMAISGLHIGLAAGGVFVLVRVVFGAFVRRRGARDMALICAALAGGLYALLSGWAVPAQRACAMLVLGTLAVLFRRRVSAGHVVGAACMAVLLADPLALHAPGFLLSFAAVCILLWRGQFLVGYPGPGNPFSRFLSILGELSKLQLLLFFGLLPLTAALFGRIAWLAPLVNLAALPVFNFLTVPSLLLGLALSGTAAPAGDMLLRIAWWSAEQLLRLLAAADALPHAGIEPSLSGPRALFVPAACLLYALLPRGAPGRHLGLVALLATLSMRPSPPPEDCFDLRVFDVGQGLAVGVRTESFVLLYDTGPAYRSGGSAARSAIGPWIRQQGLRSVDMLIVSHGDLDHRGGADWLLANIPVAEFYSSEAAAPLVRACRAGQAWQRDGVRFVMLHPDGNSSGNNASCVLRVGVGEHEVLLPGDIEAAGERSLLRGGRLGPADLVVVPHHGSSTSSGRRFVAELSPRIAIVSAGFANRWGFPRADVVARWQATGAEVVSTAAGGAISARYCARRPAPALQRERELRRRYWHD